MPRRANVALTFTFAFILLAGCGNSRTPLPVFTVAATPNGFQALSYPASGVSFSAPRDWNVIARKLPMVTLVSSATAVVALWRYPRAQPPPAGPLALSEARAGLIDAARARDHGLQLIRSGLATVDGNRAIELDVIERIAGQLRRVRSTHVFVPGAEIVLEVQAPRDGFHAVDHAVFSPLRRSLRLSAAATT